MTWYSRCEDESEHIFVFFSLPFAYESLVRIERTERRVVEKKGIDKMDSDSDYNPLTFEKKVNRSKSKQKRVRFTPETKTRMIRLYERHPCLWDTKHLDYWNRIERSKAERAIASELNYPEALVNSKWQILRNEFRTERNRVLKSRETKKVYESKWPFYQHMQFLNNHSNRPYKLGKRQFSSAGVGDSVAVKLDLDEVRCSTRPIYIRPSFFIRSSRS